MINVMVSSEEMKHPFLPQTDKEIQSMLETMNLSSVKDLFSSIPPELRFSGSMKLPRSHSEQETLRIINKILSKNVTVDEMTSYLGAGIYNHFVPSVVNQIIQRSEFITSYTPYAPEISQGMLQSLWEYQSMIAELTQLDLVNSSMYDMATALGEAALMSSRVTQNDMVLVPEYIQPERLKTLVTYAQGPNLKIVTYPCDPLTGQVDLEKLSTIISENSKRLSGVYIENPNFWGVIEENLREVRDLIENLSTLFIIGFDPISLGILKSPGELGADIAIGEGQSIGLPMNFGGPLLGLFAVKNDMKLARAMPGRIIGLSTEIGNSKKAFTMTLQTREQHIRRERATSNICTNNALCALASTVYLSLIGADGLKSIAENCLGKSSYLISNLQAIDGVTAPVFTGPTFKEFVFKINNKDLNKSFLEFMNSRNILPGYYLGKEFPSLGSSYLLAVTEQTTRDDLEKLSKAFQQFFEQQGGI
jgi:glycine dehydrogenase subunit 1